MGASYSQSTSEAIQQTKFDQSQVSQNACRTNVVNGLQNITQEFTNVRIEGDLEFAQAATVDVNCVFENNLTGVANLILDAYSSNEANSDKQRGLVGLLNLYNFEITDSTTVQDVEIILRQVMENTCQTTIDNNINNINQIFTGTYIGGDLSYTQDANAQGSCIVSNLAKLETQLKQEIEQNNQSGKARNFLKYLAIAGVIFIVVMVLFSLLFSWSKKKKQGESNCTETPDACKTKIGPELETCLRALPAPDKPFCALQAPPTAPAPAPIETESMEEEI